MIGGGVGAVLRDQDDLREETAATTGRGGDLDLDLDLDTALSRAIATCWKLLAIAYATVWGGVEESMNPRSEDDEEVLRLGGMHAS